MGEKDELNLEDLIGTDVESDSENATRRIVVPPSLSRKRSEENGESVGASLEEKEITVPSRVSPSIIMRLPKITLDSLMNPKESRKKLEEVVYSVTAKVRDEVNSSISSEVGKARNDYKNPIHAQTVERVYNIITNYVDSTYLNTREDKNFVITRVFNNILGLGPLEPLAVNKRVTEIMCSGPYRVRIEIDGALHEVPGVRFRNSEDLLDLCTGLLNTINRTISSNKPIADGRLPDNSRINIVHTDIAPKGPLLTIRRHAGERWTIRKLLENGAISADMAIDLVKWVRAGLSTVAVGSTGSGKALPLDTLIPTPDVANYPTGFTNMGELEIGDDVFGSDGKVTKIIGIYDQGEEDVYEIVFDDDSKVEASGGHLWEVFEHNERRKLQNSSNLAKRNRAPMLDSNMKEFIDEVSEEDLAINRDDLDIEKLIEHFSFKGKSDVHDTNSSSKKVVSAETMNNDHDTLPYEKDEAIKDNLTPEEPTDLKRLVEIYKHYANYKIDNKTYTISEFLPKDLSHHARRILSWCKKDYCNVSDNSEIYEPMTRNSFTGIEIILSISSRIDKILYDQRGEVEPRIITTKEMLSEGLNAPSGHRNFGVRMPEPLQFDAKFYEDGNILTTPVEVREAYIRDADIKNLSEVEKETFSMVAASLGYKTKETPAKGITISKGFRVIKSIKKIGKKKTRCIKVSAENELFLCTKHMIVTHNTTVLNALSGAIPTNVSIVTVEDNLELNLNDKLDVRSMEARPASSSGAGEISIRDLVRNSLRMRPDRLIVGEVRGQEAYDMIQAMNTGHSGSLTTFHANGPPEAMVRLESMIAQAELVRNIKPLIASAIDLLIFAERYNEDGKRRISGIYEVQNATEEKVELTPLWVFKSNFTGKNKNQDEGEFVKVSDLSSETKSKHRIHQEDLSLEEALSESD